jgi:FAD/FMN-containing dehydrogenase
MVLKPNSIEHLAELLKGAYDACSSITSCDLSLVNGLLEYNPADMTATVEAGMRLEGFQSILKTHRQFLPVDPPDDGTLTLGELLAANLSGPRRYGYGTIRDYLIGMRVALASGEVIKNGGKVVKNVAGYDLCKLFIGAKNSLGIIVEATFKLRPLPECYLLLQQDFDTIDALDSAAEAVLNSSAEPVIFDAHNLSGPLRLVIGLEGFREDVQEHQQTLENLGCVRAGSLDYSGFFQNRPVPHRFSVLPSKAAELLEKIVPEPFVARYGNGIVFSNSSSVKFEHSMPSELMRRAKQAYDPHGIFPEYQP